MADMKKYNGTAWVDTTLRQYKTVADTFTTLPADIYADGNNATVGLKGNTVQNGTPTPNNPIMPEGCGELDTIGEKAGQYKIPILSNSTTTPVYLGEVETTRRIKKVVFNGSEPWLLSGDRIYINNTDTMQLSSLICTHFPNVQVTGMWNGNNWVFQVNLSNFGMSGRDAWISYLQQQYAAGTPVTVWYVLATEETGIVNEPLMKIGDYADTVSGITIPVTAGGDTLSVDTTVQPSEVSLSYTGWHDAAVKEWDGGQW